jgi:hypothetical protein
MVRHTFPPLCPPLSIVPAFSCFTSHLAPPPDPLTNPCLPTTPNQPTDQRNQQGLGKTLQSIVVLHTLLKNGFKPGERIAKKALVVTPTRYIPPYLSIYLPTII